MGLAVAAEAKLPRLHKQRQRHEQHEGHGRLGGQQGIGPHGNLNQAPGGAQLEQHAAHLVADGQKRQQPEDDAGLSGEHAAGLVIQEHHRQRAEEQVNKYVEVQEAVGRDIAQHGLDGGKGFGRVLEDRREVAHDVAVEHQVGQRANARRRRAVDEQLPAVAPVGIEDLGEAGDQQERQREVDDVSQRVEQGGAVRGVAGIQPPAHFDDHRDLGDHDAQPAQQLEVLGVEGPQVANVVFQSGFVDPQAALLRRTGPVLIVRHVKYSPVAKDLIRL